MRAIAAAVALALVLLAGAPHVHATWSGNDGCAACLVRHADLPRAVLPDLGAPARVAVGEPAPAPGMPPVSGVALGAIPGQSPPAAA